jgi:signal transduction histidine kinase
MLADFVVSNREEILHRSRMRVAARMHPAPSEAELTNGIPIFLDQLCVALRLATHTSHIDHEQIGKSASRHGQDLFRLGLSISQVVHDYGDVCQTITELIIEQGVSLSVAEFRVFNLCLDDAIAEAVAEYSRRREIAVENLEAEHMGALIHELRNGLVTATLTFESIKTGQVAPGGATGAICHRSLVGLTNLINSAMANIRLDKGVSNIERISVADFVGELEISGQLLAQAKGQHFVVGPVDPIIEMNGDRQILSSAVTNIIQNAFKFTAKLGNISLNTRRTNGHVCFDVEDECGGLPPNSVAGMFTPYEQHSKDRSGAGLGLSICLKAAKANGGSIVVRDLPGKGCIFTLDMPRIVA